MRGIDRFLAAGSTLQENDRFSERFVEITYPFFTALFAFWLFGAVQIGASTLLGGMCIMAGLVLIAQSQP